MAFRRAQPPGRRPRLRRQVGTAILTGGAILALAQGCATENVTQVIVGSITIRPSTALLLEGGTVEFAATVIDEDGSPLDGAAVTWSTDSPDVAFVDGQGVARAVSNGVATIEASFRGISGSAVVTVLPRSAIDLEPASVPLFAGAGGEAPSSEQVRVGNHGTGTLTGLAAEVRHDGSGAWLDVELSSTTTPATLTLTPDIEGLPPGRYGATVVLSSDDPTAGQAPLQVSLSLTSFTVAESGSGTRVRESGNTDTFTAVLDLQPESDVVLSITSPDSGEVVVNPSRLTFTPSDWSTPRTVTVTGVDDVAADGDQVVEVTVTVDGEVSDPAWVPAVDAVVRVRTEDDDRAGLALTESGDGTAVAEGGGTDAFEVALDAEPPSDVVVRLASGDADELDVSPATLTFTPSDWGEPQTITASAVDDVVVDGDRTVPVTLSVEAEAGSPYSDVEERTVAVSVRDDDEAGLSLGETGGATSAAEGGGPDAITIALAAEPLTDVVVAISIDDAADAAVQPGRLTFTPATWASPQAVNLSAVDDDAADGNRQRTVTVSVDDAASADAFDGVSATATLTTVDNDVAAFAVTESRGSTVSTEGAAPDTLMVVLSARPLSNVVITITSDDPSDGAVAPGRITFTPSDWNVRRPVAFTAVDDVAADGIRLRTLTLSVDPAASHPAFHGLTRVISGVTLDNDLLRLSSQPPAG